MGRVWQAAATVKSVLKPGVLEAAVDAGLRSLFVGFETISQANLRDHGKIQNLDRDYGAAIRRLREHGVMVNGSFVFGMDDDDATVFDRTVEWAVAQGIETATFHILTPYPSTGLYRRMESEGRLLHHDWDRYDTRQAVFRPARMSGTELEEGYRRAYRDFYTWRNIVRGAASKPDWTGRARHVAYAAGWKKFERLWDGLIRAGQVSHALPVLERVLSGRGTRSAEEIAGRRADDLGAHRRGAEPRRVDAADDGHRNAGRLAHHQLGGRGQLVGDRHLGDLQGAAE
jgi:radical SAM superfamily enzyme YgiQ (UPF0313 family)